MIPEFYGIALQEDPGKDLFGLEFKGKEGISIWETERAKLKTRKLENGSYLIQSKVDGLKDIS